MRRSDFIFKYRVRNWPEYNKALIRRGSLTFWVDEEAVRAWRDAAAPGPLGGRPRIYSDTAIECALVVRAVFHLSLRATQGFLGSVVELMGVDLPIPDYTTHMPAMLDRVPDEVGQMSGDRAYDSGRCYQAILARGAVPTIPPRRNARLSTAKDPPYFRLERDAVVRRIKDEGRYPWRTASGATRQSLAENAVSRFKALVGVKLAARAFENQQVEAFGRVLNRMAWLGLPVSERVLQG